MASQLIPENLRRAVLAMYDGMTTEIETKAGVTAAVPVRRGVLQGDPLSPLLFNMCINFFLTDLNNADIQRNFGFCVNNDLALSCFAFADDLVVVGKNRAALTILVRRAMERLGSIGLMTNAAKSTVLDIGYVRGERVVNSEVVDIGGGEQLPALTSEESVLYLGVKFRCNLGFDIKEEVKEFGEKLEKIRQFDFLHADRKIKIIKQYVWPTMNYDLQMAPPGAHIITDLRSMDDVMKLFAFNCYRLPQNSPTGFLFAARCKGGLAMPRPTEEFGIQQVNAAVVLNNSTDVYVKEFRKPVQEINQVVSSMESCIVPEARDYLKPRSLGLKLRAEYREKAFES